MKNLARLFGISALVALIGLFMAACPTDSGGGGGPTFLGNTLELSGQVYTEKNNQTPTSYSLSYEKYTGSKDIPVSNGGTGAITRGVLNYSIGVPGNLSPIEDNMGMFGPWGDDEDGFALYYDNFQIQPGNADINCYILSSIDGDYWSLSKNNSTDNYNYTPNDNSTNIYSSYDRVIYVYVNSDVTISGTGKTMSGTETWPHDEDGSTFTTLTYSAKTSTFRLELKAGWNAVRDIFTHTEKWTDNFSNATSTMTLSMGNPDLRWVLWEDSHDDYGSGYSIVPSPQRLLPGAPGAKNPALNKAFSRLRRDQ